MNKRDQATRATRAKDISSRELIREFRKWGRRVSAEWRPGETTVSSRRAEQLREIILDSYEASARRAIGFDPAEYKQIILDDTREEITEEIESEFSRRLPLVIASIIATISGMMRATNAAGQEEGWTPRQATVALNNRLRNHALTVGVTETQWAVEAARKVTVVRVSDPLRNTIEEIIAFLQQGYRNEARRLSREAVALARLPLSVTQGETVGYLSGLDPRFFTPEIQAETIFNLRNRADELGMDRKEWLTVGDANVRPSHQAANGQQRGIEEPFELEGSLLQYPGDSSLGAPASEVIGCRCATLYI